MGQKHLLKIGLLYGGRSGEHEISLISARSIASHLDPNKYEVIPIGISKEGVWKSASLSSLLTQNSKSLLIPSNQKEVFLRSEKLGSGKSLLVELGNQKKVSDIEVIFPVLHGPLGEDGTIQGYFEMLETPYVGSGVLGSSVGMDKEVSKLLVQMAGGRVVPYLTVHRSEFDFELPLFSRLRQEIEKKFGFPVFVKPANMGSSVGVHKVRSKEELEGALKDAFQYDTKILIEKAISAREIELAVLSDPRQRDLVVSPPGEIKPNSQHEFYSYESKYIDEKGAEFSIPALMNDQEKKVCQDLAKLVFRALQAFGLARIDLFMDKENREIYFNEINTMPGFTQISMYPKLMESQGYPYEALLDTLIQEALSRYEAKKSLLHEFRQAPV